MNYRTVVVECFSDAGEWEYTGKYLYKKMQNGDKPIAEIAREWLKKDRKNKPWTPGTKCLIFKIGDRGFMLTEKDMQCSPSTPSSAL